MGASKNMATRDELEAEQAYMLHARHSLDVMRRSVEALKPQAATKVDRDALEARLAQRLASLVDDPDVPLFFGRIDTASPGASYHIGRRHVRDARGDPVVVDWRADVSMPFYRATRRTPMGLSRRRRFGFQRGRITAMEDELLELGQETEGLSPLVAAEIERPRTGAMRDIVATIQPEQDEIVRAGLTESICVQGGPGTGKTAVGLHRAAYLLHAHARQLRRAGMLVVGPNDDFIRYIGEVLPSLGEVDVDQVPLPELLARPAITVRGRDGEQAALVKHDVRMAGVIRRAAESRMGPAADGVAVRIGTTPVEVGPRELDRIRSRTRARRLPYEAGRLMFRNLVVERLLADAEGLISNVTGPDVSRALRASKAASGVVDALWPKVDPVAVVFRLLSEPEALAAAAGSSLGADEQRALSWTRRTSRARAPWSQADLVLIDEAAGVIERPAGYGHVVVDEAQDLSPMELRAVGRRARRSATLLGDLAQATTPWASGTWDDALRHLGIATARVETLHRAFRIQGAVLALANRLLPSIAPALPPAVAVRDAPDALALVAASSGSVPDAVAGQVVASLGRPGSVGVIVPAGSMEAVAAALAARGVESSGVGEMALGRRVTLLRAQEAKGLEFDVVVLVEPEAIAAAGDVVSLRFLYIAITRAVLRLVVVHAAPLPHQLVQG